MCLVVISCVGSVTEQQVVYNHVWIRKAVWSTKWRQCEVKRLTGSYICYLNKWTCSVVLSVSRSRGEGKVEEDLLIIKEPLENIEETLEKLKKSQPRDLSVLRLGTSYFVL